MYRAIMYRASWPLAFLAVLLLGCAPPNPLSDLQRDLGGYPEYTVILNDMKTEGTFFPEYYHQYKVVVGDKVPGSEELVYSEEVLDWRRVSKDLFRQYRPFLGMTLISKGPDGQVSYEQFPPGYQYVGNPAYGSWQTRAGGTSFWAFYGQYALLSSMFSALDPDRRITRGDYRRYRDYRTSGRPFFGSQNQYGTSGSVTRQTHGSFFERQRARQAAGRRGFSQRVRSRSNMGGFRGRAGGFGK